ncbi:LuxR family transcriptional regulator [soil metagenome]
MSIQSIPDLSGNVSAITPLPPLEQRAVFDVPLPLTSLVGREVEIAAILDRLDDPSVRLLTLTGPGGTGKTRLSMVAAHRLSAQFHHVHFIPLANTNDVDHVPIAIARAIGVRDAGRAPFEFSIRDRLGDRPALLILDNLEQVIGSATFVAALLSACPSLKIIATSRILLRISGEHEIQVLPLALPDESEPDLPHNEAVALYIDRVRAFQAGFNPDERALKAIAQICRRLDGLPLAIELAAARGKILSPEALLARLDRSLDVLTGGPRDLPAHQRTMRDTIAWSYDLLDEHERELFRNISVFPAGGTLATVESMVDSQTVEIFDLLSSLVEKSLLRITDDWDGGPRFWMLATLREFGVERLEAIGELANARARQAGIMISLVDRMSTELTGPKQSDALKTLDREDRNLVSALNVLSASGDAARFVALAASLQRYWHMRGRYREGRSWLDRAANAIEGSSIPSAVQASVLHGAGWLSLGTGDPASARPRAEASLAKALEAGDPVGQGLALSLLAAIHYRATEYERAEALLEQALALYRTAGDSAGEAIALFRLGQVEMDIDNLDRAQELFIESRRVFELSGNTYGAAAVIDNLSIVRYSQNRNAEAEALASQALAIYRQFDDWRGMAVALGHVGKCASRLGDFERSWDIHKEGLALRYEVSDRRGLSVWLEAVASLLAAIGQYEAAALAIGATESVRAEVNTPLFGNELADQQRSLAQIEAGIGKKALASALRDGAGDSLDVAIPKAIAAVELALAGVSELHAPNALTSLGLSPREQEVLELIVKRLSDLEIAEVLFISPRTVGRHANNIYTKLNVHNRREAAALAAPFFHQSSSDT